MVIQNIYDDPTFFESYRRLRKNDLGFNNVLEQPVLRSLVGDLAGQAVLDIGCGFGDFCRYAAAKGARLVVGIDPSEKMLREALKETDHPFIQYRCLPVETYQAEDNTYDLIVSSLAFHYVKDFTMLVMKMYSWLTPGGKLFFSVEHPVCTAHPKATLGESEDGQFHPIYNYRDERMFKQKWLVDGVEKYHRTLSTYVNTLLINGFHIDRLLEPMPTDEQIASHPHLAIHRIRPPLLVLCATRN